MFLKNIFKLINNSVNVFKKRKLNINIEQQFNTKYQVYNVLRRMFMVFSHFSAGENFSKSMISNDCH